MGKKFKKILFSYGIFSFVVVSVQQSYGSNLSISHVEISEQSTVNSTAKITCDISWDYSWRNHINYDAIWLFVKFSLDGGASWQHATLKTAGTNPAGFSAGSGTEVDLVIPADKKGAFIQRTFPGIGSVSLSGIQLIWDWGADGVTAVDEVQVKLFGMEMVFIPESSFYLGDGDGTSESTSAFHLNTTNQAVILSSSLTSDIRVDTNSYDDSQLESSGVGIDGDGGIDTNNDGSIDNASFPTGYKAFYVMKYEITEGQWINFFNTLSTSAKARRDITSSNGKNSDSVVNRNTVAWSGASATTLRPYRACAYLSWMDVCAYADWAGLRPLSELEFEKIARGPNAALSGEYAWGTTTLTAAATLSGTEDGTEIVTTPSANCSFNNVTLSGGDGGVGPLRSGIFARPNSGRVAAGSGFYGVMELSGNVREYYVSIGRTSGRSFQGSHGDGVLESTAGFEGNATNTDWPGYIEGQGVNSASGTGFRGGSWADVSSALRISDRSVSSIESASRDEKSGGRCGRTAP